MASEKAVVKSIIEYLNTLESCFCHKTHGGFYESLRGKPDITGVIKGRRFDFEVKADESCDATPLQEAVIRKFCRAGGIACVVRSVDEVEKILKKEGLI